jgi:hypothetical protein
MKPICTKIVRLKDNKTVYKRICPDCTEILNLIYDTLMGNNDKDHPQFDITKVSFPEVDAQAGYIKFRYSRKSHTLLIKCLTPNKRR